MRAHHEPRLSVIIQRYKFNSRQCLPSESIAEYVAALRKLAEFCNYGESLDKMLRDRFVCGIAHPTVQKRLLTETELTFTKAVTVAQAVKLAEKDAQQIQPLDDKDSKVVHKFSMTITKQGANRNKNSASKESQPMEVVIDVGGNTTNSPANSSQRPVTFAINVVTLLKFATAKSTSPYRAELLIK